MRGPSFQAGGPEGSEGALADEAPAGPAITPAFFGAPARVKHLRATVWYPDLHWAKERMGVGSLIPNRVSWRRSPLLAWASPGSRSARRSCAVMAPRRTVSWM